MKKSEYVTTRFDWDNEYYVEVAIVNGVVEFVLCKERYGIKSFMFGMYEKDCQPSEYEEYIESNIEDYIEGFEEMNEDLEELNMKRLERLNNEFVIDVDCDPDGYYANMVTSDGKAYSIQSCTSDYLNYYNDVDMCEYIESIHYSELSREDKEIYLQLLNEFKERGIDYAQEY